MSTRSGRRIHGSFHEPEVQIDAEPIAKSVKKTRSKRLKDNNEVLETTVSKSKKRNNYVSYPSDEEPLGVPEAPKDKRDESVRSMRKNTLKEQNFNISSIETVDIDVHKPIRLTRRTKKFVEDEPDHNAVQVSDPVVLGEKKGKKNKKNKSKKEGTNENEVAASKKSKKKKKSNGEVKYSTPNMSIDSFHSAAGSPVVDEVVNILNATFEKSPENQESDKSIPVRTSDRKRQSVAQLNDTPNVSFPQINTPNKKKVSRQNSTFEITEVEAVITATKLDTPNKRTRRNSTFDTTRVETVMNTTFEKEKRRSSIKNGIFKADNSISKKSDVNTTFDKNKSGTPKKLNTTFEKEERRKSLRLSTTLEAPMNSTYDKDEQKSDILNSTFFLFLGPLLYNRLKKTLNYYPLPYSIIKKSLQEYLLNLTYEDTEELLTVLK